MLESETAAVSVLGFRLTARVLKIGKMLRTNFRQKNATLRWHYTRDYFYF
jgi:hypothetical protein